MSSVHAKKELWKLIGLAETVVRLVRESGLTRPRRTPLTKRTRVASKRAKVAKTRAPRRPTTTTPERMEAS